MFDVLDLIVRGGSAASLVLFNYVSEQICSYHVQVGKLEYFNKYE